MRALLCFAAVTLLATIYLSVPIDAADGKADICRLFANNSQIGDPDSCNRYIKCIDFVSHYFDCTGSTPFYDKDTAKCAKTLSGNNSCTVSCEGKAGTFVKDPKSCKGYYYCLDDVLASAGACPDEMHFDETEQVCKYSFTSNCNVTSFDVCSNLKDGINFKDEKNCQQYHTCTKGNFTTKTCSKQYYDAATGECVQKSLVDCPEHPLPKNVCGTAKKPLKNVFVSDEATCRGYFYCRDSPDGPDTNPTWGKCGPDTFFDESTQKCVDPVNVKCSEDRCDGRTLPFVVSGTKGCRHYLRCSDGIALAELSCGNYFFDEKLGACVNAIVNYAACKA